VSVIWADDRGMHLGRKLPHRVQHEIKPLPLSNASDAQHERYICPDAK
jgi:hypothetical protein